MYTPQIAIEYIQKNLPGFFGSERLTKANFTAVTVYRLEEVKSKLTEQILRGINYVCRGDERPDCDKSRCEAKAASLTEVFLLTLPKVRSLIKTDIEAAYDGDPACFAKEEVILCYPGFLAIAIQRLAHELHALGVPLIPRIMTEYGHRRTGVDIHPGAKIGERFFIDHATGVVIGETTVIGRNVKLYHFTRRRFSNDRDARILSNLADVGSAQLLQLSV